ncbi:MAG: DUF11 domain-containing protein [Chloroflexaceae bacterium]|nr:DUF11 domain-containing protein [Chloroflexaceae bacterium]
MNSCSAICMSMSIPSKIVAAKFAARLALPRRYPRADLSVVKQADRQVRAGTPLAYTLIVTNNGPSDASPVVVVDTLPAGTTFVEGSSECQIDSTYADPTVVCVYPSLAASAT